MVLRLMQSGAAEITQAVVGAAKKGDLTAARLVIERLAPPLRERPLSLSLSDTRNVAGVSERGLHRAQSHRWQAGDRLLSRRRAAADNAGQGSDAGGPLRQRRYDVHGGEAESAGPNLTPPG